MVVQNLKLLFGRPEKDSPSESREPFLWLVKRDVRFERVPAEGEGKVGGKCVERGVGGSEGGCDVSARLKREVRREVRFEGGVESCKGKCAVLGVEGRAGRGRDETGCSAISSGVFSSAV